MYIQPLIQRNLMWMRYFEGLRENLNYGLYELKLAGYPPIKEFVNNERALANYLYGNRWGNIDPDDGYKYIGRGLVKVRGRANYEWLEKQFNYPLVEHPELLERYNVAARITGVLWGDWLNDRHILATGLYDDILEETSIDKVDMPKVVIL